MNPSPDPLSPALQSWRVQPPPDPNFRPAVWQRIREASRETWGAYVRSHLVSWSIVAALMLGIAGWTGHAAARASLDAARDAMADTYLVGLDPRVQARLRP